MAWRNRVEVSYAALRHNLVTVQQAAGGRGVIAVVKADAYGLGTQRCARIYHEAGAAAIAVAATSEADRVRAAVPAARILLLGSPLPEERPAVVASDYEVCCTTREELQEFAALARPEQPQGVHLFIDTGMGRAGCAPADAAALARMIVETPALALKGVGTHYPMAVDDAVSGEQEAVIAEVLAGLPELPEGCWVHSANSEATLMRPNSPGTVVRCGLLLTGVVPPGCPDPGLRPAMRWLSSISLVKPLPAGHAVSYNRTVILERDSLVALVPVGYADGYPFRCSGRGRVLVGGRSCSILGRVTMDYLVIDVTDCPRPPVPGDPVVLVGEDGDECITVAELADRAETIPYDVLCGLRGRCEVVGVP
ncbi:MAG: alanine racemase [Planctomycetota bacterium]|jgi:alanine racemase|nr:alanine racemase [Planctomycetota bacterium]